MMKVALLYPAYLPDLYYLACVLQSDRTILLDTEPFSRKSRVHRGKIRTPEGFQWLNIPVVTEDKKKPLPEVRIDQSADWAARHLTALEYNYRNSIYFDFYEPELRADLEQARNFEYLTGFLDFFMNRLWLYLQLDIAPERASKVNNYTNDPDRFAEILKAGHVFQEQNSRNYQRQATLRSEPDFKHPVYHQHFGGFIPGLSVLDLLFQLGPSAWEVTDKLRSA